MSGARLSPANLARIPGRVDRPAYDRKALTPSLAHIGTGAFFRCHQAEYADDLLRAGATDSAYLGINIRPPEIEPALGPQEGLYTRVLLEGDRVDRRVVGSLLSVMDGGQRMQAVVSRLADPAIRIVSMTVTEKGYCIVPATGELDTSRADLAHDLEHPERPGTLLGLLAAVLRERRSRGVAPPTLLSCDNIPANGATLRKALRAYLARTDAPLAEWFEDQVATPSTMVDRIVPATSQEDLLATADALGGLQDAGCVVGEPFRQWVIEDRFPTGRPRWEDVGVEMVADVAPYEQMKHRLVNGCQSALAYLGYLAGYAHTCDAAADPHMLAYATRMMQREFEPTLVLTGRYDLAGYQQTVRERLVNTGIRHRTYQIAMDGSQKIRQRLLGPVRDQLRLGGPIECMTLGVAAWLRYVSGVDERGHAFEVQDPLAETLRSVARSGGDASEVVARALPLGELFDRELAESARFREALTASLASLHEHGARATVQRLVAAG